MLSLTPPLVIDADALLAALDLVVSLVHETAGDREGSRRERATRSAPRSTPRCWPGCASRRGATTTRASTRWRGSSSPSSSTAAPPIGASARRSGVTPDSARSWRDVPAVPTGAFKEVALRCFPQERERATFRTSGTTGARRGELHLDTLALYEASLLPTLRRFLLPDLAAGARMRDAGAGALRDALPGLLALAHVRSA